MHCFPSIHNRTFQLLELNGPLKPRRFEARFVVHPVNWEEVFLPWLLLFGGSAHAKPFPGRSSLADSRSFSSAGLAAYVQGPSWTALNNMHNSWQPDGGQPSCRVQTVHLHIGNSSHIKFSAFGGWSGSRTRGVRLQPLAQNTHEYRMRSIQSAWTQHVNHPWPPDSATGGLPGRTCGFDDRPLAGQWQAMQNKAACRYMRSALTMDYRHRASWLGPFSTTAAAATAVM